MKSIWLGLGLAAALAAAPATQAAQYAYPAKGQDKAQQAKDLAECGAWATEQTGFDPVKAATQAAKAQATNAQTTNLTANQAMAALGAYSGKGGVPAATGGLGSVLGTASPAGGAGANTSAISSALGAFGGKRGAQAATALEAANTVNQIYGQYRAQTAPAATAAPVATAAPAAMSGQADFDQARAACLTARGYSVR